jgi:multidrug transporter EmrE-like cation transporter
LNFILLLVPVILSTLIWPVSRWVMLKDGRTDAYGFWISISGAIAAGFLGLAMGQSYSGQALWWVGLMIAFAFAVGFCLIINYCLKIGPTGPTVAANNMGLVGPVIVGLLWPTSRVFTLLIGAGLGLVVLALVGFGVGPTLSVANQQRMSSRWAILVMLRYRRAWFRKNEFIGGLVQGPCQAVSIYVSLLALQRMGAQIVFPVTVLAPVMAVLLLSGFVYKERLHPITWISCVVGVSGLALLALSR